MSVITPIVYVVDDDPASLQTTKALLSSHHWNLICLSEAAKFLELYRPEHLGCLVVDLKFPQTSGLELQKTLSDNNMDIPIVFISGEASVETTVTAMKAGAHDFIEKPLTRDTVHQIVEAALASQAAQRKELHRLEVAKKKFSELTEREWEVLKAMISGPRILSSKEVARELEISHRTVEHHRARIMDKTQCPSLPELIRLASFIGIANPNLPVDS